MISEFSIFLIATSTFALGKFNDGNEVDHSELVVDTKFGKVLGSNFVTEDENAFKYKGFRGIPYAQPPTGDLRFKAPVEPKSWDGILDATHEATICMQPSFSTMSEDCLYLNVYTPDLNGSNPVMVWIYGGFFLLGSSRKSLYGPDFLIQENVVLVTINYRVGIFGFMSTEDDISSGNYALKDQIQALRWVQENIAAFGGNPKQVTIFGESAGSCSVSLLLNAKPAKGLFHAAIMESGVSLSLFARTRKPLSMAKKTAKVFNITASDNVDLVEELRKVDALSLLEASLRKDFTSTSFLGNPSNGLLFAPTLEPTNSKDAVLTGPCHEQLKNGDFNRVPVIVGYNSAEGNSFAIAAEKSFPLLMLEYDLMHNMLVPIDLNINFFNISTTLKVASKIKQYYFGKKTIRSQLNKVSEFISDDQFIRPTNEFVRLLSEYTDVFYYEFGYATKNLNTTGGLPGVEHTAEIPYIWNTGINIPNEDLSTRRKLVKMWTNFAKFKNPTPECDEELDNVLWKPSNSLNFTYLNIGSSLKISTNPRKETIDFWRAIYEEYGNPPYDTY